MGRINIIEDQHVLPFPGEGDRFLRVGVAYLIEHRRLDPRSITVVGVRWQLVFSKLLEHHLACQWIERGDVEESRVVEPGPFARAWVACYGGPYLARPQPVAAFPLALNPRLETVLLDCRLIRRLEYCLPR